MKNRLIGTAAAVVGLSASTLALAPASAQAAGTCTLTAPAKVSIWKPYQAITLRASGACATTGGHASWDLMHPNQGFEDIAIFNGATTDVWDVYDWVDLGLQTWRPSSAYDANDNDLTQNAPTTDIRLYGAAWVGSKRSGTLVTLTGTALVWSPMYEAFVRRAGAVGQFQYRDRGSTVWHPLKQVTTAGSAGTVSWSYRTSAIRDYRFATYSTSTIWSITSANTTR